MTDSTAPVRLGDRQMLLAASSTIGARQHGANDLSSHDGHEAEPRIEREIAQ